jgi:hypothetical protein
VVKFVDIFVDIFIVIENLIGKFLSFTFHVLLQIFFICVILSPIIRPLLTKTLRFQDIIFLSLLVINLIFLLIPSRRNMIEKSMDDSIEGFVFLLTAMGLIMYFMITVLPIILEMISKYCR